MSQEEVDDQVIGAPGASQPKTADLEPVDRRTQLPDHLKLELRSADGSVIQADLIYLIRTTAAQALPDGVARPAWMKNEFWTVTYIRSFFGG